MTKNNFFRLAVSILGCNLAGVLGSFFTLGSIDSWYSTLSKPFFTPPGWVFGPAWITLYTLMGIAFYWVWSSGDKKSLAAMWLFGIHLFFNAIWSIIFFGLKLPGWALADIVILWILIIWVMIRFYRISKKAGLIMIPYLLWVSFASILNFSIWWLEVS